MPETPPIARKLAALESLGFERVDLSPVTTEAVSITALARSQPRAEEAIGRALEEMDRLIGVFSRFEGTSAIAELNDAGRLDCAPPEFSHVLSRSLAYHEQSGGAFDITVEPLVDLFRDRLDGVTPREPTPWPERWPTMGSRAT
jgi:thiamine biosynthesis lipoprotein ApbE